MIMQHIALFTPCIAFILVSHTCVFAINPVEQELEELHEPAPAEEANPEQEQARPGASNHLP
jgi:hypothetical protein